MRFLQRTLHPTSYTMQVSTRVLNSEELKNELQFYSYRCLSSDFWLYASLEDEPRINLNSVHLLSCEAFLKSIVESPFPQEMNSFF
jgi:hypothetical protein